MKMKKKSIVRLIHRTFEKNPVMNICHKTSNTFYRYSLLLVISGIIKKAMSDINCRRTLSQFQYAQKHVGQKTFCNFLYLIVAQRGNMVMSHIAKKKKKKKCADQLQRLERSIEFLRSKL